MCRSVARAFASVITTLALAVMLVPIVPGGVQQAQAAGNPYPTASELYVSGKPMSEYTGSNATYNASTGTLTISNQVTGIEIQASSARDLTIVGNGRVSVFARTNYPNFRNRANIIAISNATGGNLNIRATGGKQFSINSVIADDASPSTGMVGIKKVEGLYCRGNVTLDGDEGSNFNIYARSDWYVKDGSSTTRTSGTDIITAGIDCTGHVTIQGDVAGRVDIQTYGEVTSIDKCNSTVRLGSGSKLNISASGDWTFDSQACSDTSAIVYYNTGRSLPVVASSAGVVRFIPGGHADKDYFVIDGNNRTSAMSELPEVDGHALELNSSQCYYRKDARIRIMSTTIQLTEVPALGTQGKITEDNTRLDITFNPARYTMKRANWWYKNTGSDTWSMLGSTQFLPTDATAVRTSFELVANGGYRFANTTNVVVKLPNGQLRNTTEWNYMHPASTESSGTFYVDVELADISEQHPIDKVEIYNVATPTSQRKAWVNTDKASMTSNSGQIPQNGNYTHYTWASNGEYGTAPGFQYWTTVNNDASQSDGTVVPAGTNFSPDATYRWHCYLYAKEGWKFANDTAATVDGTSALLRVVAGSEGKLAHISRTWKSPALIVSEVAVEDVVEPVAGQTANVSASVPEDATYSIASGAYSAYWYEGTAPTSDVFSKDPFTGTFQADVQYTYVVYLEPVQGYAFGNNGIRYTNDANLIQNSTINGKRYWYGHYYHGPNKLMMCRTFYCTNPDAISRIDIAQTMPVAGQTAQGNATSLTPGVTLDVIGPEWRAQAEGLGADASRIPTDATSVWIGSLFDDDDQINPDAFMPVFENSAVGIERRYTLNARARVADGVFARDSDGVVSVKAFVGGVPAIVSIDPDDSSLATITLSYKMPTAGSNAHMLFVPTGVQLQRATNDDSWATWSPTETDYYGMGYDLYDTAEEGMNFRVSTFYPSTWKTPSGEEFYKWYSSSDDVVFEGSVRNPRTNFTMPAHDTTIDILTQPEGTLPTEMRSLEVNGYITSAGWKDPDTLGWTVYNGQTQWREAVLVDNKGTTETDDDYTLVKERDYSVSYEPAKGANAGSYTVTYTGIPGARNHGGYEGAITTTYSIDKAILDDCTITVNTAHTDPAVNPGDSPTCWEYFTGDAITPGVTVKHGDYTLVEGTDYDLEYYWNTGVGTAHVQVNCKGNFAGWTWLPFEIRAHDISDATITAPADVTFNGTWQEPDLTVVCGGITLKKGEDYYASYDNNYDAGIATVRIEGISERGWTGTKEVTFTILPHDISDPAIQWNPYGPYWYTGEERKPVYGYVGNLPGVGGLNVGGALDVAYADNKFPGQATATLTGKSNWTGTHELHFDIFMSLADSSLYSGVQDSYAYTGAPIKPEPTVKLDDLQLKRGRDYELQYGENTDAGNGSVTVVPKDEVHFIDSHYISFTITQASIASAKVASIPDQLYTGDPIKPELSITFNGKALVEDTDYAITGYDDNTDVGTATIHINGINNFKDSADINFGIVTQRSIKDASVASIADQTYIGTSITPKPEVTYAGEKLVLDTDYTLSYSNNIEPGTATVTITGKGNYVGTTKVSFKIVEGVGEDGTPLGAGVSAKAAEAAILASSSEEGPAGTRFSLMKAKLAKVTKSSVTLKWSKVKGAVGYSIYGNACGKKNKYFKIKSVKGTKFTEKKLRKGTYYKYLIVAFDKDGNVITASKTIHAATKGGKVGNDGKVKLSKKKATLKKGKSLKLKAKVTPKSKKLEVKRHRKTAWESSNPTVAKVNNKGKVTAKKKGKATIWAYAQDGVAAKCTVTVK